MDLITHFVGAEPVRIFAEGGALTHPGAPVIDTVAVTISFANGRVASLAQADAGETPHLGKFSYQLVDGERSVHLHNRLKRGEFFDGTEQRRIEDDRELGMIGENREFIRALTTGTGPATDVHDGIRATVMTHAVAEAVRTGEPQKIWSGESG